MTVREKIALRILLLVAKILAPQSWQKDIETIETQIIVYVKEKTNV